MATLNIPSYDGDPTSTAPIVDACAAVIDFRLSSPRRTVGFTVGYYRSTADYQANVSPVNTATYRVAPDAGTRADGATIPSYDQVVGTALTLESDPVGTLAFAIVQRAIYAFLLGLPEFAGATVVA